MARYIVSTTVTPTDGEDIMTLVSAASRRLRIAQVTVGGVGTTSAAQGLIVTRSSGGTSGGGALTSRKFDSADQPSAAATVNTTWTGQPTIEAEGEEMVWNSLGGSNRWIPPRGEGFEVRDGGQISIRAKVAATFQPCRVTVIYDED